MCKIANTSAQKCPLPSTLLVLVSLSFTTAQAAARWPGCARDGSLKPRKIAGKGLSHTLQLGQLDTYGLTASRLGGNFVRRSRTGQQFCQRRRKLCIGGRQMERKDIACCSSFSGPKVLVTGGAGFVGSHVCETLLESDCDITVLDAFLHAARAGTSSVAPDRSFSPRSVRTIRGDLRDRNAVRAVLKSTLPEIVIHLAALPLLTAARDNPDLTVAINVDGTRNLLEELTAPGTVRRFVYLSSSSVYGHFRYRPIDEGHPTEPTEVYGRTKLIGEQLTRLFCSTRGVE